MDKSIGTTPTYRLSPSCAGEPGQPYGTMSFDSCQTWESRSSDKEEEPNPGLTRLYEIKSAHRMLRQGYLVVETTPLPC